MSKGSESPGRKGPLELGSQDLLDVVDIGDLLGITPDAVRVLVEHGHLPGAPCAPSALVAFCEAPERRGGIPLPEDFVVTVAARERDDQWRDDLIAALRERGLAEAVIGYADFLKLTTFSPDPSVAHAHTDIEHGRYALRRDEAGVVVGIEAGAMGRGTSMEGENQGTAHLELPVKLEQLVRWIRDQAGDVELKARSADEIARAVPSAAGMPRVSGSTRAAHRTHADRMKLEIERALEEGIEAVPAKVRAWLAAQAGKEGSCIVAAAADGIIWTNSEGEHEKLKGSDLRKRLKRIRDRVGSHNDR